MDQKEKLDVYVALNVPDNHDDTIIMNLIRVYIATKYQNYQLNTMSQFANPQTSGLDAIQQGMHTFANMHKDLKLKQTHDVWFIYVSVGKIKALKNETTVLMINTSPLVQECKYVINKNALHLPKEGSKELKLNNVKLLTKCMDEIFSTNKQIKYGGSVLGMS
jgi:hypothetical protein